MCVSGTPKAAPKAKGDHLDPQWSLQGPLLSRGLPLFEGVMGWDLQGQAVWGRVSASLWAVAHVRSGGGQVEGHSLG